jgi:hypothetical protein
MNLIKAMDPSWSTAKSSLHAMAASFNNLLSSAPSWLKYFDTTYDYLIGHDKIKRSSQNVCH